MYDDRTFVGLPLLLHIDLSELHCFLTTLEPPLLFVNICISFVCISKCLNLNTYLFFSI